MNQFDIVIKNGRVIDPASNKDATQYIGIKGRRIAALSSEPLEGKNTIDATGCIVTPGLIDFHTHLYDGGSHYGIRPDFMLSQGVTAAVDAGTAGSAGFEAFYRSVIQTSALHIKAFVSLGANGLSDPKHHQNYEEENVNIERLQELKEKYPDTILGIKVAMSKHDVGDLGITPLLTAVKIAEAVSPDMRVCVHSTNPPCESGELLSVLRPGDILCHCFHGTGSGIIDETGIVKDAYREARRRGVLFDMANGISHFSHESALSAISQGFLPDIISSDMVSFAYGFSPRNRSLPYVMSKLTAMGMRLQDVIRAVTVVPAGLMGYGEVLGSLIPGALADICILRVEQGRYFFEDAMNTIFEGNIMLQPQLTIKEGRIAFFQNNFI